MYFDKDTNIIPWNTFDWKERKAIHGILFIRESYRMANSVHNASYVVAVGMRRVSVAFPGPHKQSANPLGLMQCPE